jgi:hypothetical protein
MVSGKSVISDPMKIAKLPHLKMKSSEAIQPLVLDLETLRHDPVWAAYIICMQQPGLAFHPDTQGSDYIAEGGGSAFTPTEAANE